MKYKAMLRVIDNGEDVIEDAKEFQAIYYFKRIKEISDYFLRNN